MKIKGTVKKVKGIQALVELDSEKLKPGMPITITVGKTRSNQSNRFYWTYLTWVINNHLKEQGFFCPEALHESLKKKFLSEKEYDNGKFKTFFTGSTAELTRKEMYEYVESIDNFVCEFFEIDTSPFFKEYADVYSNY